MLRTLSTRARGWVNSRVVDLFRIRARRRLRSLEPGAVTVVTVNWNSVDYLRVLVDAVRRFSAPDVRILVVDNGSKDESRQYLQARADVDAVLLPTNFGHGLALDIGFLSARTEFVVALDVDAFPLRDDWLDRLVGALRDGHTIAGAREKRSYIHPCCLAMRVERFVARNHSFRDTYHRTGEDVGEAMSRRDGGPLAFLEPTTRRGPGSVGTVFGDVVYHNFYSTRFAATAAATLDTVVARDDPAAAWADAVQTYLS